MTVGMVLTLPIFQLQPRDKIEMVITGKDIADVVKHVAHRTPEVANDIKKNVKDAIINRLTDDSEKLAYEKQAMINEEITKMIEKGKLRINNEITSKKEANRDHRTRPSYLKSQIHEFGIVDNYSKQDKTSNNDVDTFDI